ncbi:unnamed protein product [Spirodela intermedia]|uniref:Pseudouridine synthase RsuA/RluA-like domain-containing protein n=1 Tax=Spirodela intermedia TaxID=51605 RepID=A0A7I8IB31_SPIIN|nr:unnamed protein product [Spirodela intermedia]CAA6654788.1 unnamed protein product [Spirodela intermedia]
MATADTERPPASTFGVPWPALNDGLTYSDVVKSISPDTTLLQFYSSEYASSAPVQGWLQRIKNGQITIDGQVVTDPETTLSAGLPRFPWEEPYASYKLEVLYEDDDVIALNKPSGLQVLPGGLFQQRTVLTQLQWQANKSTSSSCISRTLVVKDRHPVPVHRLGRGTSGILLCAKTKHAKVRLASYFADGTSAVKRKFHTDAECLRKVFKLYRALVTGIIELDESPIGVIHYPGVSKGLYVASSSGKPALSKAIVLERNVQRNQTLVQVEIQSGRPHQIRIHLAFIGHPCCVLEYLLTGDPLYVSGGRPNCIPSERTDDNFAEDGGYRKPSKPVPGDCGYHLHAHKLVLCHPSTNQDRDHRPAPPMLRVRGELDQAEAAEKMPA